MATRVPPVGVDHPTTVPTNLHEVMDPEGDEELRGDDDALSASSDDADD